MATQEPADLELARQVLKETTAGEVRDALELLIAHASQLPDWNCDAVQNKDFIEVRYGAPSGEQPFSAVFDQSSICWRLRSPAGLRSNAADLLREASPAVESRPEGPNVKYVRHLLGEDFEVEIHPDGDIAVQLPTVEHVKWILLLSFPYAPRIYTQAHLRSVARQFADEYTHGTDDAPLGVAKDLGRYPPGEAAAISAATMKFLSKDRSRGFAAFLLEVAHGNVLPVREALENLAAKLRGQ